MSPQVQPVPDPVPSTVAAEPTPTDGVSPRPAPASPPPTAATPRIEAEPSDLIHVGAGGKLIVPREDIDADLDDGDEIDLLDVRLKIKKPAPNEWVILNRASELVTKLLVYKENPDDFDVAYYYVHPGLRGPVSGQIRQVRVLLYYSLKTKSFGLWIIKATVGNSWYEALNELLKRPPEFFLTNQIRIIPDKASKRDTILRRNFDGTVPWPAKSVESLLGEALGEDHIIRSPEHRLYRELTDGEEVV